MTRKIGINGFGRMGRLALRAAWGIPELEFTQVNETSCDVLGSAHLLQFDSVHGKWDVDCSAQGDALQIAARRIDYTSNVAIEATDWSGCDVVIEATGQFRQLDSLTAYLEQGVRKVIVAAPVEGALNVVYGINHALYRPDVHHILTAASCTTNCLAPIVKVMHESVGIVHGSMTTIHDATNSQTIVDRGHKDLRRARAASLSLIPTTTGSAQAITKIFPELAGKLNGLAVRVPLLNASLTDFVFEAARATTVKEVNGYLAAAASGPLKGILGYEIRPLVSVDYRGDPRSAVIDALSTLVVDQTQVKVLAWYDNEWGYVNRMMELTRDIARRLDD